MRTNLLVLLTVAPVASATAQPKQPPTSAVACVPSDAGTRWVVAAGIATACFAADDGKPERCWSFSPKAAPKPVAVPAKEAPPKPEAEVRDDGRIVSACVGTTCKKLGKKTLAALAKARSTGQDVFGRPITTVVT